MTHKQCPKLTPARLPVAGKFNVRRVEITYVHAHLASKILRTIKKVIIEKMKYQILVCSLDKPELLAAHNIDGSL